MQIKITDEAREALEKRAAEENKFNIRIVFQGYGWGGPRLGLALDEPKADDQKISEGKLTFLVDDYLANIHDVKIDYRDSWLGKGFVVYTNSAC